ncbi:MAG TPA: hypothetical protein DCR43_03675 [Bacteroidales bacterium]|nr:MAG: hypothetical protein A2X11_00370 [Bacteroidetes bacterium GWE2_42_24]OFY27744.1 MAG: hypothetical protein A2X09_02530 [Bacteroidetes bacterium GWF2_43_11]PKP23784.1 MAG: hypothetical protein CVU06_06490 [Bacteroidetes bacterium HGW-Bacteroidetes-22]HAQ64943.1 hypothetical protein [Bacteroidales bacterium]HBZ66102.1 hypothetical protein [Bacteroidales bacterium]
MIIIPNLLIVTGNARNVGKTTLVDAIIRKFAERHKIIGLKVSILRSDENVFHGHHHGEPPQTYLIEEETDHSGSSDTSRMILAGACRSWYVRAQPDYLEKALSEFLTIAPTDALIVAESRALRTVAEPSILILIERRNPWIGLKSIEDLIPLASMHIRTGPGYLSLPKTLKRIDTNGKSWHLNV